jgi:hypothetical protein
MAKLTAGQAKQLTHKTMLDHLWWSLLFHPHDNLTKRVRLHQQFEEGKPATVPCVPCFLKRVDGMAARQVTDSVPTDYACVELAWCKVEHCSGERGDILLGQCELCGRIYYQAKEVQRETD